MFLHVTDAKHIEGHCVRLTFNDGTSAELNFEGLLDGPIFFPLRDVEYFKSFSIVGNTLSWPNGADFAPEYLRSLVSDTARI